MQTVKEAANHAAESVKGAAEKLTGSNEQKQKQEQEKGEIQGGGMHAEAIQPGLRQLYNVQSVLASWNWFSSACEWPWVSPCGVASRCLSCRRTLVNHLLKVSGFQEGTF
jgi:hypothetical protein